MWVTYLESTKCFIASTQHTTRTFHNLEGQVESRDSGLWINSFDYTGMQHVTPIIQEINDSVRTRCREDRPFCGYPWFLPVKFLSKSVTEWPTAEFHTLHVFVFRFSIFCILLHLRHFDLFSGKTGTCLPQKYLLALLWSSACCPKRRRAGGRSRWPSVWKVRGTLYEDLWHWYKRTKIIWRYSWLTLTWDLSQTVITCLQELDTDAQVLLKVCTCSTVYPVLFRPQPHVPVPYASPWSQPLHLVVRWRDTSVWPERRILYLLFPRSGCPHMDLLVWNTGIPWN